MAGWMDVNSYGVSAQKSQGFAEEATKRNWGIDFDNELAEQLGVVVVVVVVYWPGPEKIEKNKQLTSGGSVFRFATMISLSSISISSPFIVLSVDSIDAAGAAAASDACCCWSGVAAAGAAVVVVVVVVVAVED
eukprot:GEZU01010171.1.p2 GENE.GEZU01010171.1~~GEZU01010171.1.p2  ORF type:complete len:134 (-),score=44.08 GEZU01010171.1:448-849(-)